ncbi:TIGR01777 family oxidoreductase [Paenibacillus sp. XY044]|uniref:TIGR01777 family oxidoreductase n=1 Tax=Paenibacillus sp. XY044 TaxID=2026089 RepID=UPI000B98BD58|nr:TIGR01777 family oxidoreductase [Paenibacillus sp. XY044]OZB96073.1 TIGR01777 family protein [Paenibacillus sp. XY044]
MKVAICGGTGFIGSALSEHLLQNGQEVIVVTRKLPPGQTRDPRLTLYTWDQIAHHPELMEGLDAVVNLAGSSLSQRWTAKAKDSIIQSRLTTVDAIDKLVAELHSKPGVVIQASAIAVYGTSWTDTFDENSPTRVMDFPSDVVSQWEDAADKIQGVRLVKLRIGVVLGNQGGAFPIMCLPYRLGVGGKIGSGRQWLSWIHLEDIVRLIEFCMTHPAAEGPVNATAPEPVTNDQFGRAVGRAYHRPHWFPVPSFMMKAVLGEQSLIILEGQRILPAKALALGFEFRYPRLQEALDNLSSEKD